MARMMLCVAVCLLSLALATPAAQVDDTGAPKLEVGKPPPDFTLEDHNGREVKLSGLRGKKAVLLAFYPKNFSRGCTEELRGLGAEHDTFLKSGVQVFGVSTDTVDSNRKFAEELQLPFPLLADIDGKVSEAYGILIVTPKGDLLSGRSVFLIDRSGIVCYADAKFELRPADDREALLKAVQGLRDRASGGVTGQDERSGARAAAPRIEGLKFGRIVVDGKEYSTDVILDGGAVRKRDKKPSSGEKERYGHTPLTLSEQIPWGCKTLIVGTGMEGRLPVVDDLKKEAERRGIKLLLFQTPAAVEYLKKHYDDSTNAILHVTC
jgi:peroxiredoxin